LNKSFANSHTDKKAPNLICSGVLYILKRSSILVKLAI